MPTSVKKSEGSHVRGDLRIVVRSAKTGRVIRRMQIKNMITANGLKALVDVFRQHATTPPSNYKFTELRVGKNATPPLRTDTGLVEQVAQIDLTEDSTKQSQLADPYEIKIIATLPSTAGNGLTLCEAAIGMANGQIFSRQTYPGIPKTDALVIDYDWRITFTA